VINSVLPENKNMLQKERSGSRSADKAEIFRDFAI
jgi:hypothetical protein